MIVSKYWLPEERLNVVNLISARWGDNIHSAPKDELMEALKAVRVVSGLNAETCELNREMIMRFTLKADCA